jgi:hypothetical protein
VERGMKEPVRKVMLLEPIDVGKIKIDRDHYFPGAYVIDLPLDSTPGHVWQDIFEREWKLSRQLWDRKLFLIGDELRLLTHPENIEEKLDWIRDVLERTNTSVELYNREAKAVEADTAKQARRRILEEKKSKTEMIRDALRKRFGSL